MSNSERGLYISLLCIQWNRGAVSQADIDRIATPSFSGDVAIVVGKFRVGNDGLFRNERMEIERVKQVEYRKSCSSRAKSGAYARWGKHRSSNAQALLKNSSPSPSPSPKERTPAGAEGKDFIEGWCQNYKEAWKVDYCFNGSRDGKAVRELMGLGITRLDLLETAKKAWAVNPPTFDTRQSQTIHGFRAYINQLNLIAKNGNTRSTPSKPNPRNFGIVVGTTNYATAKTKYDREREAQEAAVAKQVAPAENNPPPA